MNRKIGSIFFLLLIIPSLCNAEETVNMNNQIDQRSYRLGGLSTFAEMVRVGVKNPCPERSRDA